MSYHFIKFWLLLHDRDRDNLLCPGYGFVPRILNFAQDEPSWTESTVHNHSTHLDPLESDGGILDAMRGVKAFCSGDVGIDHPLPEVMQRRTEALFQQFLLILTLPRGSQTQARGKEAHRFIRKGKSKKGGWGLKWVRAGGLIAQGAQTSVSMTGSLRGRVWGSESENAAEPAHTRIHWHICTQIHTYTHECG